jgi:hypothetical protein
MFDPRTLCTPPLFFQPWTHTGARLLLRAPVPTKLAARLPAPPRLEGADRLPIPNAHFVLLEDDDPRSLAAFMTAWDKGPPHRRLAFWIPRRFTEKPVELTAARLLNGLRVPDDPELVSGWLADHLHRPATWAEVRAVLDFFQGGNTDEPVLQSPDVARFFTDHGGREAARNQFFRLQHQCLQALFAHHRDALVEKNLAVIVFDRRESLLADRAGRRQWLQIAQALAAAVVPVSRDTDPDTGRLRFTVLSPLGATPAPDTPDWVRQADEAWRRVNPPPSRTP